MTVAETLGVDPSDVDAWMAAGADIGEVEQLTDELVRYLKDDRIPTVVRRPAQRLGDRSLVGLLAEGRSAEALAATMAMFDFGRVGDNADDTAGADRGREPMATDELETLEGMADHARGGALSPEEQVAMGTAVLRAVYEMGRLRARADRCGDALVRMVWEYGSDADRQALHDLAATVLSDTDGAMMRLTDRLAVALYSVQDHYRLPLESDDLDTIAAVLARHAVPEGDLHGLPLAVTEALRGEHE